MHFGIEFKTLIAEDLLATARRLAKASPRKPRQADLRRSISTAYYALFHALAADGSQLALTDLAHQWPDWTVLVVTYLASIEAYEAESVLLGAFADLEEQAARRARPYEVASAFAQLRDLLASALARKTALALEAQSWPAALADYIDDAGRLDLAAAQRVCDLANELGNGTVTYAEVIDRWPAWPQIVLGFAEHYRVRQLIAALEFLDPGTQPLGSTSALCRRIAALAVWKVQVYINRQRLLCDVCDRNGWRWRRRRGWAC